MEVVALGVVGTQAQRDQQVLLVELEVLVYRGQQVQPGVLVQRAQPDLLEQKEVQDLEAELDPQDRLDLLVHKDLQVWQDEMAILELRVFKVHLGTPVLVVQGLQALRGHQATREARG